MPVKPLEVILANSSMVARFQEALGGALQKAQIKSYTIAAPSGGTKVILSFSEEVTPINPVYVKASEIFNQLVPGFAPVAEAGRV